MTRFIFDRTTDFLLLLAIGFFGSAIVISIACAAEVQPMDAATEWGAWAFLIASCIAFWLLVRRKPDVAEDRDTRPHGDTTGMR